MSSRPGQAVTRAQLLAMIRAALSDAERAIRSHPPETVGFYERAKAAHEVGVAVAPEADWSEAVGLSLPDLATIHRYLFAMSFIAVYWELHADIVRRNKAASSAAMLVAGLGVDPVAVLGRLIQYEHAWKQGMVAEGFVPAPGWPFPSAS